MKRILTCSIGLFIFLNSAFATILRVGYPGTPVAGVDYATIQPAHDAAKIGDTIQIYPNNTGSRGTISKKLYFVGFGFNLNNDSSVQAMRVQYPSTASFLFTAGSQGTIVEGINIQTETYVYINDITFKRSSQEGNLYFAAALDSIQFISCYIRGAITGGTFDHTNVSFLNCLITNNSGKLDFSVNTTGRIINCIGIPNTSNGTKLIISNSKFLVKNCIMDLFTIYSGPTANTI